MDREFDPRSWVSEVTVFSEGTDVKTGEKKPITGPDGEVQHLATAFRNDGIRFISYGSTPVEARTNLDTYLNPVCKCAVGGVDDCPIHTKEGRFR
jgi:hypothetical protein